VHVLIERRETDGVMQLSVDVPSIGAVQCQVFPHGAGEEQRVLRQVADESSPLVSRELREWQPVDQDRARFDRMNSQDRPGECALASANGPGDADERSGRDVETQLA
jgi:hypothetical protein